MSLLKQCIKKYILNFCFIKYNLQIKRRIRSDGAFYLVKDKLRAFFNLFSISNQNQRKARVINIPSIYIIIIIL